MNKDFVEVKLSEKKVENVGGCPNGRQRSTGSPTGG